MKLKTVHTLFVVVLALASVGALAAEKKAAKKTEKMAGSEKITFDDHVLPIFRDNCLKCHNPDKLKGDQDLTSYGGTIKGGGSGSGVVAGDPDGSLLVKVLTHAAEPYMPPNSPPMDPKLVATIRKWIEGGLLESSGSKAVAAVKSSVTTLSVAAVGKPDGPPPMPGKLSLEPVVHVVRQTAISAMVSSPWAPLLSVGSHKQIALYNTADLEYLGVIPFPEGFPHDLKFSRNGKLLLAGGGHGAKSGDVVVWDIAKGERVIAIGGEYDSVLAADISSDQKWIALGGPDRLVKIFDTKDGSLEHKIKKHTDWVTALEFSPDSKYLATGDRSGGVMMWEAASGQELFSLTGHKGPITALSWRPDSGVLLSASEDGALILWSPRDGQSLKRWAPHSAVLGARFAMDGKIVSVGRDNKVMLWDATGNSLRQLPFKGELPNRAVFSQDGAKVFAADFSGRISVWNAANGAELGVLDSAPPTLAERVEQSGRRLGELQAALDKASAEQAKLEVEAKLAKDNLDKASQSLKDAQAGLAAKEQEIKSLATESAKDATNAELKAKLKAAKEETVKLQAAIKKLNALDGLTALTKLADLATTKATEAKAVVEKTLGDVTAAKNSLSKWKAAQQGAPNRKVAAR
ncbi:MAG: hypothetical protein HY301_06540 [Verrucomicrobia bacterium]|nr:hypothetical protein [Verrucomicrobiota bacterium]